MIKESLFCRQYFFRNNISRQYQAVDGAVKKKSLATGKDKKAGSPGDWFDDDIKF